MVEPGFCFSPTTFVPSRLRVRKRTGPTSRAKRLTPRRQDAKGEDEEGGERKNGRTWVFLLPKNLSAFAPSRETKNRAHVAGEEEERVGRRKYCTSRA